MLPYIKKEMLLYEKQCPNRKTSKDFSFIEDKFYSSLQQNKNQLPTFPHFAEFPQFSIFVPASR
jgi:hypothetical protein